MEYYREWDRQYDEQRAKAEDARMLAYERKKPKDDAWSSHTTAAKKPSPPLRRPSKKKRHCVSNGISSKGTVLKFWMATKL